MGWQDPVHGQLDSEDELSEVTFKEKVDEQGETTDVLVAREWVDDIQPGGVDHLHAWGQNTAEPDHHDMREDDPLFPDVPGAF